MSPSMDMLKRIQLESRGKKADQVVELNLDNCRSTGEPEGLSTEYESLEKLSMINVGFTSLKGFPTLPTLRKLELSDNRITGTLGCLKGCKTLTHLNLSGNKIKTFDSLEPLADLTNLKSLDLFNNEVTKSDGYRDKVFKLLPSLTYLDGFDANDVEAVDSEDEEVSGDEHEEENGHENGNHLDEEDDEDDDFDEEDDDDDNDGEADSDDDESVKLLEGEESNEATTNGNGVHKEVAGGSNEVVTIDSDDDLDDEDDEEEVYDLAYLNKENIEDDSDDGDYDEEDEDEEEDIEDDSDNEAGGEPPRKVRKQEEEAEGK